MSGIFSRKIGPVKQLGERTSDFLQRVAIYYGFWAIAFFLIEVVVIAVLMSVFDEPNDYGLLAIISFNVIWVILFFIALISFLVSRFLRYREGA